MYRVIHNATGFLGMQATFIKRNRIIRYSGMTASFVLFLITILTAFPIVVKDDETRAAAPKASDTVLAMTTGSETASVDITVSSASGTFAASDSTKTAKFGVTTNNYTGYTLTIVGTDDTGLLTNTDTSITTNNTLSSISSATSADTFSTSTALNDKWGYQPSKYNSTANTSFLPAPTTTASILDTTGTANPTTPNNYTIGVGARVDYSKPAGDYASTFILAAVGNPVGYSITYSDDTGDASVANLPTTQSGVSASTSAILNPNSTPTRTGYTFKSWCLGTVSDNGTTCTGTEYVSGDTIDFIDQTINTNTADLYAVWDVNTYSLAITFDGTGVSSVQVRTEAGSGGTLIGTVSTSGDSVSGLAFNATYYLYPVFSDGYGLDSWENTGSYGTLSSTSDTNPTFSMGAGDSAVTITGKASMINVGNMQGLDPSSCTANAAFATDIRDDQDYIIQRLEDGNCWMLDNLRLSDSSIALTSRNSNVPYTTSNPWYLPESSSSGFSSYDAKMIDTEYVDVTTTSYGIGSGKIGTYYNYCAATAGTYCYAPGATTSNAQYDICPKGWRMPTGGPDSEYQALYTAYSSDQATFKEALSTPLSGHIYYNVTDHYQGQLGYFWSSTYYNVITQRALYVTGSEANPQNSEIRNYGASVRCILDTTPYEKLQAGDLSMQDIGKLSADDKHTLLSKMEDDYYSVPDERDGQTYVIQKLDDDNLWMMTNLNLNTTNVNLTSDNTNCVTSGSSTDCVATGLSNATLGTSTFNAWKKTSGTATRTAAELIPLTAENTSDGSDTDSYNGLPYGTLYNYCAATAGTVCANSNSNNASYDICPKGWRLPTSGSNGEFLNLYNQPAYHTLADMRKSYTEGGAAFAYTGQFYNSTPTSQGATGYYWSSTRYDSSRMLTLHLRNNGTQVNVTDYVERGSGHSVRCILDIPSPYEMLQDGDLTMQRIGDLSASDKTTLLSEMEDAVSYNSPDVRDEQVYTVAKINNRVWMTKNLAIGCNGGGFNYGSSVRPKSITSDFSNVSSAWSTPTELLSTGANSGAASGYDTAAIMCNSTYGAWYNYAATTAGTITGSDNTDTQVYDICPKGWRLPNNTEFADLVNTSGAATSFNPVAGGFYNSGSINSATFGIWAGATSWKSNNRYGLQYDGNKSTINSNINLRHYGLYTRCILESAT